MQELNDSFFQLHRTLAYLAVGTLIICTVATFIWAWKKRFQLFDFERSTVPVLVLGGSDFALVVFLFFAPLLGIPAAIMDLLLVVGILLIWQVQGRSYLIFLELKGDQILSTIATSVVIALGIYLPLQLIGGLIDYLLRHFGWNMPFEPAVQLFLHVSSLHQVLPLLALAVFAAPMAEEFLFRGLIYPASKRFFSPFVAMLFSSFLFAALHLHLPSFLPLMIFGMILCRLFEVTGSLWTSILVHSIFNAASALSLCAMRFYSGK